MNIVILTFYSAHNYGALLQCYALSKIVEDSGHSVTVLNIPLKKKHRLKELFRVIAMTFQTNKFRKKFLPPKTKIFNSYEDLRINYPKADLYIVGSDQVWNPDITKSLYEVFFFNFLNDDQKRIAYAASFGIEQWPEDLRTDPIKKYLSRFEGIGIRENEGVDICEQSFNTKAKLVIDPTLLLSDYSKLIKENNRINQDSIVCYKYSYDMGFERFIEELSNIMLKSYTILNKVSFKFDSNANYIPFPTVNRWISEIYSSSFVVTDSFHCMVFAILFKKPFLVFAADPKRISRIISLLKQLDLDERFYFRYEDVFKDNKWKKEIDYEVVFKKLEPLISDSFDFLNNFLIQK
jgi:hypothetical protein